jgi:hypothetical protein
MFAAATGGMADADFGGVTEGCVPLTFNCESFHLIGRFGWFVRPLLSPLPMPPVERPAFPGVMSIVTEKYGDGGLLAIREPARRSCHLATDQPSVPLLLQPASRRGPRVLCALPKPARLR